MKKWGFCWFDMVIVLAWLLIAVAIIVMLLVAPHS